MFHQLVQEAALCVNGVRHRRTLRQKGFEVLNGLPLVATDPQIHKLLDAHTVEEANSLQFGLGQVRELNGHFPGRYILLDPHRINSTSKRQMQLTKPNGVGRATKTLQTFFTLDAESCQPLVARVGSPAITATQATLELVDRIASIVRNQALVIGDKEHFTVEILTYLSQHPTLDFKRAL